MKRRIVLADDDPTIVNLVSLRLRVADFDVLSAADSDEALALIRESAPMAAILDLRMPGGGGLALLAKLKSDPATRNLPVLILSCERDSATVMRAMEAGADDYMVKPFKPDRLLERVNKLVQSGAGDWASAMWEL